jgi:CheY-like chemotaxis protein
MVVTNAKIYKGAYPRYIMKPAIIADDEEAVRGLVRRVIGIVSPGREVDEVTNGKDLVEKVRTGNYAFAVTDHNMPQMSGLEAIAYIREFDKETPICICTADSDKTEADNVGKEASRKGANDYVNKNGDLVRNLMGVVRKYCETGR